MNRSAKPKVTRAAPEALDAATRAEATRRFDRWWPEHRASFLARLKAAKHRSQQDWRARKALDKLHLDVVACLGLAGELRGQVGPDSPYASALVRMDLHLVKLRSLINMQIKVTRAEEFNSNDFVAAHSIGTKDEFRSWKLSMDEAALFEVPTTTAHDSHRRAVLYVLQDMNMLPAKPAAVSSRQATPEWTRACMAAAASLVAGGSLPSSGGKTPGAVLEQEAKLMRALAIESGVVDMVPILRRSFRDAVRDAKRTRKLAPSLQGDPRTLERLDHFAARHALPCVLQQLCRHRALASVADLLLLSPRDILAYPEVTPELLQRLESALVGDGLCLAVPAPKVAKEVLSVSRTIEKRRLLLASLASPRN